MDQFQFPQPCPMFKTVKTAEHKEAYIGLTQYYRLYANKIELSNNRDTSSLVADSPLQLC